MKEPKGRLEGKIGGEEEERALSGSMQVTTSSTSRTSARPPGEALGLTGVPGDRVEEVGEAAPARGSQRTEGYLITHPRIRRDMKKEMSSFDVGAVVREMSALEDGHLDKVYQSGSDVLFRINTKGAGKADLFFRGGKWLYLSPDRPETDQSPGPFAAYLRKNLANARIGVSEQQGSDRAVVTKVYKSDGEYSLIFRLFGGGNILLVRDGIIVNCLVQRTFRETVTRPGQPYEAAQQRFNPFTASEKEFLETFRTSVADTVRTLATVNNLGGQYAEEICARAGIRKDIPSQDVPDGDVSALYSALRSVISDMRDNPLSLIYRKDGHIIDLAPTDLRMHADAEKEEVPSLSEAIGRLMAET